jgi:hypothetical protein
MPLLSIWFCTVLEGNLYLTEIKRKWMLYCNGIVRRLFRLKHQENLLRVTTCFWWLSSPLALCTNLLIVTALRIVNIFPVSMDYCNRSLCPLIWLASSWSQIPPDVNSKLISNVESWNICWRQTWPLSPHSQGETRLCPLWRRLNLKEKLYFVLCDNINDMPFCCTHRQCALRRASRDLSGSKERLFSRMNSENFLTNTGS